MRSVVHVAGAAATALVLSGCAQEPTTQPVKPVVVKVVASSFCQTMTAVLPPTGTLRWAPSNSPGSISDARAVNAAVRKSCVDKKPATRTP